MYYLYAFAGISAVLMFLQLIQKVSLSHPVPVYAGIVLFPVWCVYTFQDMLTRLTRILQSHTVIPSESLLDIFGSFSIPLIINLLQALFFMGFPYLLFLMGYVKMNLYPYKKIAKGCMQQERVSAMQIACTRLCRYALAMQAVYLPIATIIFVKMVEPIILGSSMLAVSLAWGSAGVLLLLLILPPIGVLALLVLAGVSTAMVITMLIPLLFAAFLLTAASVLTLNAVIRTGRFMGKKVLKIALLSLLPGMNIGILIHFLLCLSRQKSNAFMPEQ